MVLRLVLICHAPTTATRTASFPSGEPLDGPGRETAQTVLHRFSDAARCLRSPALAAQPSGPNRADLRECDYGCWAGRSIDAVHIGDPEEQNGGWTIRRAARMEASLYLPCSARFSVARRAGG